MSRRTGECCAEVVFESRSGRFRCHFSQHRARKKADGDLQQPHHEIAEAAGRENKVIESQLRRTAVVIEEKTGMDFERFTRSILLAQGGFDTFLKADTEQKSKILEQITGTEIYSEISRRVHECQRGEREKLNLLQAEISGIAILEPEQEKAIGLELEDKQKQEIELSVKVTAAAEAVTWLTGIDELKKEIRLLSKEAVELQAGIETFKPKRDKLNRALKAATLEGSYAILTTIRKQQLEDRETLSTEKKALPELEAGAEQLAERLKSAEQQTGKAKQELKDAAPLIQTVRALDQKLTEQKKAAAEVEKSCREAAKKIELDKKTKLKELEKRTETEKELKLTADYLKKQARDEWLVSNLAGVEVQLCRLLSQQKEIAQQEAEHEKAAAALKQTAKRLDADTGKCGLRRQELAEASKELRQEKAALDTLLGDRQLREYRAEKDALLREYLNMMQKLLLVE